MTVVLAACASGSSAGLQISDPWARPVPASAPNAALFMMINNESDIDERLVGASSDACRVIEVHQSSMQDGVMRMEQLADGIAVDASEEVELAPGGLHLMCIDTQLDFAEGQEIDVTLEFRTGSGSSHAETVTAVVEDR